MCWSYRIQGVNFKLSKGDGEIGNLRLGETARGESVHARLAEVFGVKGKV